MNQFVWATVGWLVLLASSNAASFDCTKATSKIEKMICNDSDLSQLDEDLSAAYRSALQEGKQSEELKQDQRRWIKERNSCSDITCVKESYKSRIATLSLGMKVAVIKGKGNPVCSEVGLNKARYVNFEHMHAMRQYEPGIHVSDGLAIVDIDNDGNPDNIVRVDQSFGRCDSAYLAITNDSRTGISETKSNETLKQLGSCGSSAQEIFIIDKTTYIDVHNQNGNRAVYMIRNGNADAVCEFQSYTSFSEGPDQ